MPELELKVTEARNLTHSIKMFELVAVGGGDLPEFDAGAHIDIHTGAGVVRSYSLANDPADRSRYVTAILREENGGGGSKWMHDTVAIGDVLKTSEPSNNFPLKEDAGESIFLAGGIGITPMMAMGHRLKSIGGKCHLHYCSKSADDTAFLEEAKTLFGDNITFHHDGGDPSKGIKKNEVFAIRPDGAHLYVCGPAGLLNAVRTAVAHWPDDAVHFELFTSARTEEEQAEVATRGNEAFEIELAKTGTTLTVPADKTILDVLLDEGLSVPYACEEGWCGACIIDLVSGKGDHRDEVLSNAEKEADNKIQVCISRAMPGEKLVLDL
ncbi:MAG: oxidoreductase [Rhodospirillales bacterium]|nr:oxidoreductase [Rhodospirillales bacterium]